MEFTSAFNTVNIGLLLERFQRLRVNTTLVLWIKDFFLKIDLSMLGSYNPCCETLSYSLSIQSKSYRWYVTFKIC